MSLAALPRELTADESAWSRGFWLDFGSQLRSRIWRIASLMRLTRAMSCSMAALEPWRDVGEVTPPAGLAGAGLPPRLAADRELHRHLAVVARAVAGLDHRQVHARPAAGAGALVARAAPCLLGPDLAGSPGRAA